MTSVAVIILTILKVIGVILLVILGLVLLMGILVLYTPFRYRVKGSYSDQTGDYEVLIRVRWLFIHVLAEAGKDQKPSWSVSCFGKQLLPREKKKRPSAETEKSLPALSSDKKKNGQRKVLTGNQTDKKDMGSHVRTEEIDTVPLKTGTGTGNENLQTVQTSESEKNASRERKKARTKSFSVSKMLNRLAEKTDHLVAGCLSAYQKLMLRTDHLLQFLGKPYVQKTWKHIRKLIRILLSSVKPRKSRGRLHFGLESAADTGMTLGKAAVFYPLYGKWLTLDPDFQQKVLEGDLDARGRIFLGPIAFPAVRLYLSKDLKRTISLAKKI